MDLTGSNSKKRRDHDEEKSENHVDGWKEVASRRSAASPPDNKPMPSVAPDCSELIINDANRRERQERRSVWFIGNLQEDASE